MEKAAKDVVKGTKGGPHGSHGQRTTAEHPKEDRTREAGSASPCWASAYDKSLGFSRNCKGAFEGLMNTAA